MTLSLVVLDGRHKHEVFPLRRGINLVGRSLKAEVHLGDDGVSRRHANICIDGRDRIVIRDINSTNGTFLNGKRVATCVAKVGDQVRIGTLATLRLQSSSPDVGRASRETRRVEQDAPTPRRGSPSEPKVSFLSKLYLMEPSLGAAKPCWGYSGDALEAYERLLRIRTKKLGSNHIAVAELLEVMGSALQDNMRLDEALDCYKRAHSIYSNPANALKSQAARTLVRRAHCELSQVQNKAALTSFERAEKLLVEDGANDCELACVRLSIARVLWLLKQELARGLRLARETETLFRSGGATTSALRDSAEKYAQLIEMAIGRQDKDTARGSSTQPANFAHFAT